MRAKTRAIVVLAVLLCVSPACWAVEVVYQGRLDRDPTYTAYGFGVSMALSGDTILVGDVGMYGSAAHVFERASGAWARQQHFGPTASVPSHFAGSLALDDDWAVAGNLWDSTYGDYAGGAFMYHRTAGGWVQQCRLPSPGLTEFDNFSQAVAISGNWAVVGCPRDSTAGQEVGAVYVYENRGGTWEFASKLVPPDAQSQADFGRSLAIDDGVLVVGASYFSDGRWGTGNHRGAAYVYELSEAGSWTQTAKLQGHPLPAHLQADLYAFDVDVDGDLIIVGAPDDSLAELNAGAAYIYQRTAGLWQEQAALTPQDLGGLNEFAQNVAISQELGLAAIAGQCDYDSGYFFEYGAGGWTESAGFQSTLGIWPYAREVAIDGHTLAIASMTSGDEHIRVFAIPEPGTLSLLALGGLAMLRRKRA